MLKAVLILATATTLYAACDNQCSGHGSCLTDDVCQCYDNWGVGMSHDSGDCSERICPYELAWVDTPDTTGSFHKYAECGGKGICDRSTGLCECFEGYEGKACHRTTCPNDCSGHGTCEYIDDIGYRAVWHDYSTLDFQSDTKKFRHYSWDSRKIRGCVCDAQYADVDCSKRMCPYGNDILAVHDNVLVSAKHQKQTIVFLEDTNIGARLAGKTFALTFKSKLNETFTTVPISFDYASIADFEIDIRLALLSLPNQVIDDCTVTANYADPEMTVVIEFTGLAVQGPQYLLSVEDYECSNGCTPKLTGLPLQTKISADMSNITETQASELNSYECGRRGKCDYSTGLCACFEGYTGDNCNTQTTLV